MPHRLNLTLVLLAWLAPLAARAEPPRTIIDDLPGAGRLAAPATGQSLFVLDETNRAVVGVDPFGPSRRWRAIGPADLDAGAATPVQPLAIASVDSNTLAVLCVAAGEWSLRTFRLSPSGGDEPTPRPLQTLQLGTSPASAKTVDVVVSDSRDWLAVVGLPTPLAPVVRAPIAGVRLGGFSERLCPPAPAGVAAATASPFDEWIMFSRPGGGPADPTSLAFYANSGRLRLLELDLRLTGVHDAACCRGDGSLWVVADTDGGQADTAGLYRIDASLVAGRQTATAVSVARLPSPISVVCLTERAVAISGGGGDRRVLLVNPTAGPPAAP